MNTLRQKIKDKTAQIAVIGLGYVGLPVAAIFAETGFDVLGVDILPERVARINKGISPIEGDEPGLADLLSRTVNSGRLRATSNYETLKDRDIILIAVETPVDTSHEPRYEALKAVLKDLAAVLKHNSLVIVESTIAPGTMQELVLPILEGTDGRRLNRDFYLGNCPERVMPGKLIQNLRTMGRVVGGMTPETADTMTALYRQITQGELDPTDCITAELVKTTENAYRDVQIAFANEVALICEAVGGDVWKVRKLVNKIPGRQMHLPGAGVGGHCIPKDPWLLAYGVRGKNVPLRLIPTAREVNDSMPQHMLDLLEQALTGFGKKLVGSRIAVLGYAYLEESDDVRNSPSGVLVNLLRNAGADPVIHDPWVEEFKGDLYERVKGCDAAVVMVGHGEYKRIDIEKFLPALRHPIFVDGRNVSRNLGTKSVSAVYPLGRVIKKAGNS